MVTVYKDVVVWAIRKAASGVGYWGICQDAKMVAILETICCLPLQPS